MDPKEQREHDEQAASAEAEGGTEAERRERVLRETREAGMRAEGGGSADEADIAAAAAEKEQ